MLLRMVYRFAGEVTDVEALLARGLAAGPRLGEDPVKVEKPAGGGEPAQPGPFVATSKVDNKETGEAKGVAEV